SDVHRRTEAYDIGEDAIHESVATVPGDWRVSESVGGASEPGCGSGAQVFRYVEAHDRAGARKLNIPRRANYSGAEIRTGRTGVLRSWQNLARSGRGHR